VSFLGNRRMILHPHFSPDITLGHLLQAAVVIVTGGGGILAGYLSLRADLDSQRAEYRMTLAAHEARLVEAEHELDDRRREEHEFQVEMRTALARVMEAIGGLRTELVQKENRR
jgi:hypothetical protein